MRAGTQAIIAALLVGIGTAGWGPAARGTVSARPSAGPVHDYLVQPVPFTAVHLDDVEGVHDLDAVLAAIDDFGDAHLNSR